MHLADRKLQWLRQSLGRTERILKYAPWMESIHEGLKTLVPALQERKQKTPPEQWQIDVVTIVPTLGNALEIIERAPGVRVPHYLLGPLSRLLDSYLGQSHRELALVSSWTGFNYSVSPTFGPGLASLLKLYAADAAGGEDMVKRLEAITIISTPAGDEDDVLQHCLLAHELAHIVVECGTLPTTGTDIGVPSSASQKVRFRLYRWLKELQCDAIATHMIGPSYVFALLHRVPPLTSTETHPSTSARCLTCLLMLQRERAPRGAPTVKRLVQEVVPSQRRLRSKLDSELRATPELADIGYGAATLRRSVASIVDGVGEAFGRGYGYGGNTFGKRSVSEVPAVEALMCHTPPGYGVVSANAQTGTVIKTADEVQAIWLAGWLVELMPSLWARFTKPLGRPGEDAGAARKLSALVAKGIEAADTLGARQG